MLVVEYHPTLAGRLVKAVGGNVNVSGHVRTPFAQKSGSSTTFRWVKRPHCRPPAGILTSGFGDTYVKFYLVGAPRFELGTSSLSGTRPFPFRKSPSTSGIFLIVSPVYIPWIARAFAHVRSFRRPKSILADDGSSGKRGYISKDAALPRFPAEVGRKRRPVRVAPVGLGGRSPQRLDHQHQVATSIMLQPFHEPVVKSADLHDANELLANSSRLLQLAAKLSEFRPAGADLTTKDHVAVLVA